MSTILKALRRVEKEHPAQPQRRSMRGDIVAGPGQPPQPRRKKSRGPNLVMWGSLGAALLLAVLVWWRLPTAEDADLVAAQPPVAVERTPTAARAARPPPEPIAAASEPAAALEPAAASVPAAAAPAAAVPVASPDLPVEVAQQLPPLGQTLDAPIPEPAPAAAPVPSPAIEPTAPPAPSPSAEPAAPVAPREQPPPAPAPSPNAEPAAPVARSEPSPPPVPPAPAPVAKSHPPAAPPPAAKPPPVAAKRVLAPPPPSAPTIQVERISWHPKPERRLAWVRLEGSAAGREVHEGDALGTLVVKEIRPSAVVFLHGTEQLSRRVGKH